jgi:RNA polymerase sigma-70 factor (ECF subfamily)
LKLLENAVDEQHQIAAAQRDPAEFAELYENNFARIYAFIARRVPSRQDAEDLTAEVFHEALRTLARFEWQGAPFAAWLLGIASHRLTERWRRSGLRPEVAENDWDETGVDARTEENLILFQLVDELPPDQRLVICGRFVDQKSLKEIAQELRRSEGAIKQLQFRALQNLRSRMRSRYV